MKLKKVITFLYLVISLPLFICLKLEFLIWISFFINYLFLTLITYYHLNLENNYSPFISSFIVFNFLFFLVAPMIQVSSIDSNEFLFPNGLPYDSWSVVFGNILILIFNLIFFIAYFYFKGKNPYVDLQDINHKIFFRLPVVLLVLFIICLLVTFSNYSFLVDQFERPNWMKTDESIGMLLLRKKVLFMIPLGAITITYRYLIKKNKITNNTLIAFFILIILVVLLLFLKNPFTEKRNALGPIYITLIYLFYPKLLNSNVKMFLFLFVSMILVFPSISAITHINATFDQIIKTPNILISSFNESGGLVRTFHTLHYDAFSNVLATVEFVTKNGYSYGYQLLSAILFFIPRSYWPSKPVSTGELVGNYLISDHGFNFNNLSNPVVSEGYINFGFFGIALLAVILAFFIVRFLHWLRAKDSLKEIIAFYFAIHLMFLLRGDFTNGFVYFIGTFLGVFFIPKMIINFFKI